MPTELYDPLNVFAVAFKFDADINFGLNLPFELTKKKVEGRGKISDYIGELPKQCTLEGRVTAMAITPALPNPQKLVNAAADLEQLADKRQLVLVLSELYSGYLGIEQGQITKAVDDGASFRASLRMTRIELTEVGVGQVPASKLKASIKRVAASGKKGGASGGSVVPKTFTLGLAQKLGFFKG